VFHLAYTSTTTNTSLPSTMNKYYQMATPGHLQNMYGFCCLCIKEAALSYQSSIYRIQDLRNAKTIGICKIYTTHCRHQLRGNTTHRPRHRHHHCHRPPPWVRGYGRRSVHHWGLQEGNNVSLLTIVRRCTSRNKFQNQLLT